MSDDVQAAEDEAQSDDTTPMMSWVAIQFIQRPSSSLLFGSVMLVAALSLAAIAATFIIEVDVTVNAAGEVIADPAVVKVISRKDGQLLSLKYKPGEKVHKDEIIGMLQMDIGEEEGESVLQRLYDNVGKIEGATRTKGPPSDIELGESLTLTKEVDILETIASLQSAWRDVSQSLSGLGGYEKEKNNFIHINKILEGKLSSYLERHRIRASADGTLAAIHVTVNSAVQGGRIIASILPEGASFVAWSEVESKDIPEVRVGARAIHRMEGFPFHIFGSFEGEVKSVEQVLGEGDSGSSIKYFIRSSIRPPKNVQLALSMKVETRIVTKRNTIKNLFLERLLGPGA